VIPRFLRVEGAGRAGIPTPGALVWLESQVSMIINNYQFDSCCKKESDMGKPTVAIIGTRKTCSYCKKLYAITKDGALQKLLPGADVVDADPSASQADFNKYVKLAKASGKIPIVAVFGSDGKLKGKFVGRTDTVSPFTVERVAEMVFALCADCEIAETPIETTATVKCTCGYKAKFCSACGKAVSLAVVAFLLSGCVLTTARMKPATAAEPTPQVKVFRFAFLYPFEVADMSVDKAGTFHVGKYSTDGGESGVVAIMDKGGNLIGTVAKGAVAK